MAADEKDRPGLSRKILIFFSFVFLMLAGAGALYFRLSARRSLNEMEAKRNSMRLNMSGNRKSCNIKQIFDRSGDGTFEDLKRYAGSCGPGFTSYANYFTIHPKDGVIREVYVREDEKKKSLKSVIFYLRPGVSGIEKIKPILSGIPVAYEADPELVRWENLTGTLYVLGYKNFITITLMDNKHLLNPGRYETGTQNALILWFRYLGSALTGSPPNLSEREKTALTGIHYKINDILNAGLEKAGPVELMDKIKKRFPEAGIEVFVFDTIRIQVDLKDVSYMEIRIPNRKGQKLSDVTFTFLGTALNRAVAGLDCAFGKHTKKVKNLLKKEYEDSWPQKNGIFVSKYGNSVRFYGVVAKKLINTVRIFVKCMKKAN